MARPLRIQFDGAFYHVVSRGNERRDIVRDDADRQRRLFWLQRTVEIYGWRILAFALLDNHEHLFLETPRPNLSAGMQYLNGSYTSYFNRRHRRAGHLFQGRFRGHLIEQQGYFLEVSRYIHLNPVRAKLVARPEQWPWSSYPGYRDVRRVLPWVTYSRVLGEFGRRSGESRRRYARFVLAGLAEPPSSPFTAAVGGLVLGSLDFLAGLRNRLDRLAPDPAIPQLDALRERPSLAEIAAAAAAHFGGEARRWSGGSRCDDVSRAVAAYLARRHFKYAARETAAALGYRSHGGVHNALRRVEAALPSLRTAMEKLHRRLGDT